MAVRSLVFLQKAAEHHNGRRTYRQIDPKDERPTEVLDEEGAECGTDDRRDTPDARDEALDPGALGRTIEVTDDGRRDRQNGACARPLQPAKQDQRHHIPSQSAQP